VHIAEGLLPMRQALLWTAVALPALAMGFPELRRRAGVRTGMIGALIFATTLLPVPVPVVGLTSHMCATPLLGLIFGPRALIVPTGIVLLLQALFFAHGGLTTWGANVLSLGVVGPLAALGFSALLQRIPLTVAQRVGVSCSLASLAVYGASAAILAAGLDGAPLGVWWGRLLLGLAPAQLPLALLEGVLSAWMAKTLLRRVPDQVPAAWRSARPAIPVGPLVMLIGLTGLLGGCAFAGVDDHVFVGMAETAGRTASGPVIDLEGGELGRALFGSAMLACGFVLGRGWQRLQADAAGEAPDAPRA
jgi:cobalt/nickel transport system permease protein